MTLIICLLLADLVFLVRPVQTPMERRLAGRERAAREMGRGFDPRNEAAVARALRAAGADAYPAALGPFLRWEDPVFRDSLLPLAGVSNVMTVLCGEFGRHVLFRADEHGFRNPRGHWSAGRARVVLIGDSFTAGQCAVDSLAPASFVRRREPATLAVAYPGAGPLSQLGLVREYLPALRPAVVVWVHYEGNDLNDLVDESKHALLRRYTEPSFTQNLIQRQGEVDSVLRDWFGRRQRLEADREARAPRVSPAATAAEMLKLFHLRQAIAKVLEDQPTNRCCDLGLFERILRQARDEVRAGGGELRFVYLPHATAYRPEETEPRQLQAYPDVMAIACRLGLRPLDLRARMSGRPDRESHFPRARYDSPHFTPDGFRAFNDELTTWLERAGSFGGPTAEAPGTCAPGASIPDAGR